MFEYRTMETKQLAGELSTLNDENFCSIIREIDSAKLKEIQVLLSIEKKMRVMQELQSRKSVETSQKPVEKTTKINLPITDFNVSPTPNLLLRSSLFSASKTHGALTEAVRDFEINTYGTKASISLTAFRPLNQLDLDLLLELIKLQQKYNSYTIKVSAYELIKNTKGIGEGKAQYEQIKEQIKLLRNANIEIKHGRYEFIGGFLNNAYFDNDEQLYVIEFNSKLSPLFSNNNWTGINTNIRKQLRTNLAKWLHGFYSSHLNSNIPIKLETIYQLSGAVDKNYPRWISETVIKALEDLKKVFIKNGKRFNYKIIDEKLLINKAQSSSQNKSIKYRIIKQKK